VAAILIGVGMLLQVFFLPETVYVRNDARAEEGSSQSFLSRVFRKAGFRIPKRDPTNSHSFFFVFSRPIVMLTFPAVLLPSLWFGVVRSLVSFPTYSTYLTEHILD
jgi:hypothetical protein